MHLKCLEIERFKSFGPYTRIPLLDGFTVVSGPNGSGKSNIIDALLFALGLSTSRGMRAEKLSDLLHQGLRKGEATVTATFGDGVAREWTVSRRLKVNGDHYTSTYYLNGAVCGLGELHEHLALHHIYPEGYNVVLQGDVTGIITMSARERREIIDELSGVADFDRKIDAAKRELSEVEQRADRLQVIESELKEQLARLEQERRKAEEYRQLRIELQQLAGWEQVLLARQLDAQIEALARELVLSEQLLGEFVERSGKLALELEEEEDRLDTVNTRIKAMGETEQVALRSRIAALTAQRQQVEQSLDELAQQQALGESRQRTLDSELDELDVRLLGFTQMHTEQAVLVEQWQVRTERDKAALETGRTELEQASASSQQWLAEQTELRRELERLQQEHDPLERRRDRLADSLARVTTQIEQLQAESEQLRVAVGQLDIHSQQADQQSEAATAELVRVRSELEGERAQSLTDRGTLRRLEKERAEKQRDLDRLETQRQVWREAEGSRATQEILGSGLAGVCGLVRQLGRVEQSYQTALEIAAGGRLNHVVVEDDTVAARAIDLLKQRRSGRATFLPLNKLKPGWRLDPLRDEGAIGYAIDLVDFEPKYESVFALVLGDTVIFRTLELARRQLGRYRMVTLDGELLEKSGAMTGGSPEARRTGGFERRESSEVLAMTRRLEDLDAVLGSLNERVEQRERRILELQKAVDAAQRTQVMAEGRALSLSKDLHQQRSRLQQIHHRLEQALTEEQQDQTEYAGLEVQLEPLGLKLIQVRERLHQFENSDTHRTWLQVQQQVRELETEVRRTEVQMRSAETDLQKLRLDEQLCQEKRQNLLARRLEWTAQKSDYERKDHELRTQIQLHGHQLTGLDAQMGEIETRLVEVKRERDAQEKKVRQLAHLKQQNTWQHNEEQQRQQQHSELLAELKRKQLSAPNDVSPVPEGLTLEQIQSQKPRKQRRLESLEPVNMLAIEEYARTEQRLGDLSDKLHTLRHERTELLIRIEDFATLKRDAFMQAFDAVNDHFQTIFAQLSDGDGHLSLENPEDPFAAGLTLIAHPRGKKVRRLESMSGGEKSLTALSFIFALQRYRPSPFYAFDEVDMFLDGANVERLAQMIRQQADVNQFLVVSLRRPMIERADRAIGVTLARGGHSQVLGVKIQADAAS
ncbi:MAG: chromosome segregation protein SMC [Gemmatimonadaceae bacterium]|nr:chromosome segregation protein SMC [Gloeobacterales cyanobacterium ES-bin-141]